MEMINERRRLMNLCHKIAFELSTLAGHFKASLITFKAQCTVLLDCMTIIWRVNKYPVLLTII